MPAAKIETVAIFSKPGSEQAAKLVPDLLTWLADRKIATRIDPETAVYASRNDALPRDHAAREAQLIIVLGGDGTLLSAARAIGGRDIPLFAVNLGSLGFLTAIRVDELYDQLDRTLGGACNLGLRRTLHIELWRQGKCTAAYHALNDVTLAKAEIARMIELEVHVDSHLMCVYRADGLVISTPTGSTAYSLSAGGPIIFPTIAALCLTPICPHTLTQRPVILPENAIVEITPRGQATFLTVDGQVGELMAPGDRVICRLSSHSIHLVEPPAKSFFDVLREKLQWGGR